MSPYTLATALLLTTASLAHAQADPRHDPRGHNDPMLVACQSVRPGADWVCVNGGWLPPGLAPVTPRVPEVVGPEPRLAAGTFRLGHTYRRDATGTVVYIAAAGQVSNGVAVIAMECLTVAAEDQCYAMNIGRFVVAHALTLGWTDITGEVR